jgi:hypothetical protein
MSNIPILTAMLVPMESLALHHQPPPPVTGALDAQPALSVAPSGVERAAEVLTPVALELLQKLHRQFEPRRRALLAARQQRQVAFDAGEWPEFLPASVDVRGAEWHIAPVPGDLIDRRVEITGPPDRKMIINALNAPVRTFMADFEDSCSPTWDNLVRGQVNLADAVRRQISYSDPSGKLYRLNPRRRSTCGSTVSRCRARCSIFRSSSPSTTRRWHAPARDPISICRNWKAISRRGSGTTCSSLPRSTWVWPAAPSRRRY